MGDLELLGQHEEEHHIRIDIFPKKVQDRLHAFDENGDGLITQNELAEVMMELDRDDTKVNIYSKVIMGGAFLWILTLTVVAMLIFGIVETTKEMKSKGAVMVNTKGETLQCANSDFFVQDGVLTSRISGNRRLDDSSNRRLQSVKPSSVKMDVQKIGITLSSDSSGKDIDNLQSVKLVSPDGRSSVTLKVEATSKTVGGGVQLQTTAGFVTINDTHQMFNTADSGSANSMVSQGFFLFDPVVNTDNYPGPWSFVISYTPRQLPPAAAPTPMPTFSNGTLSSKNELWYKIGRNYTGIYNESDTADGVKLPALNITEPTDGPTQSPVFPPSTVDGNELIHSRRLQELNFEEVLGLGRLHENSFAKNSKRLHETYNYHNEIYKRASSESLTGADISLSADAPLYWNGTMINGNLVVTYDWYTNPSNKRKKPLSMVYPQTSSGIMKAIVDYFPKYNTDAVKSNTKDAVWLNNKNFLCYLTITGDYLGDVPIFLPSQFILVMKNARIEAKPDFLTYHEESPGDQSTMAGCNPYNESPCKLSDNLIGWNITGLVVMVDSAFSGVVSSNGPSSAYLGCTKMADFDVQTKHGGPPGVVVVRGGPTYIEGLTIDKCGQDSGNIVLYGYGRSEVSNNILKNSRSRGIWVIMMSYAVIYNNEIYGSGKFGIDLDADSGPLTVFFQNDVHDNGFQGVFIEQGSIQGIIADNDIYRNIQGVSFYNNDYQTLCEDHVIINNLCHDNIAAGINIGSLTFPTKELSPLYQGWKKDNSSMLRLFPDASIGMVSSDSYMVGNKIYNNGIGNNLGSKFGISANGAVYGMVFMDNTLMAQADGISKAVYDSNTLSNGRVVIVDQMNRLSADLAKKPPMLYKANNMTIMNGVATKCLTGIGSYAASADKYSTGNAPNCKTIIGSFVGSSTSLLNKFITANFPPPLTGDLTVAGVVPNIPSMWHRNTQSMNFLTLSGTYSADEPLVIPKNLVLVMDGATIVAVTTMVATTVPKGVIDARFADFSSIVSPGANGVIDCGVVSGPAGIYIESSSYFSVDGITVNNCGGSLGAISIVADRNDRKVGNSTSIMNSVINGATGNGIFVTQATRPVLQNNVITASSGSGVFVSGDVEGAIISGNTISKSAAHGVHIGYGSTLSTVRSNMISSNKGSGISIFNGGDSKMIENTCIITNQISSNLENSIIFRIDGKAAIIASTVIVGNTMNSNNNGIGVIDDFGKGLRNTFLGRNDDSNGIMPSFSSLTNGNPNLVRIRAHPSAPVHAKQNQWTDTDGRGNFFFDPMGRGKVSARPALPLGNAILGVKTN